LYTFLIKRWVTINVNWSGTLILLPIAYVVGILLHQFASKFFHEYKVASMLMLDEDSKEPLTKKFTAEFKAKVKEAYTDLFKLPADGKNDEQGQMYLLCNDYVLQQGKGIYVENHYAIYSLCRSMVLVSLFSGFAALISWWISTGYGTHMVLGLLFSGFAGLISWWLSTGCETHFVCRDFLVLLLILFSAAVSTLTFWYAKERFIKTLAIAVYRSFYSAYCDLKMPSHKSTASGKDDD
jgi:hypothetical protein